MDGVLFTGMYMSGYGQYYLIFKQAMSMLSSDMGGQQQPQQNGESVFSMAYKGYSMLRGAMQSAPADAPAPAAAPAAAAAPPPPTATQRVDEVIAKLAAAGAKTTTEQVVEQSKQNPTSYMQMTLFISFVAAFLDFKGHMGRESVKRKLNARLASSKNQNSLTQMWVQCDNILDPRTHILNVMNSLMILLYNFLGMQVREDGFKGITKGLDALITWQVLARLLQLYNLEPVRIVSGTLAAAFADQGAAMLAAAAPPPPPPSKGMFDRAAGIYNGLVGGGSSD